MTMPVPLRAPHTVSASTVSASARRVGEVTPALTILAMAVDRGMGLCAIVLKAGKVTIVRPRSFVKKIAATTACVLTVSASVTLTGKESRVASL
jgi:hypothetical protein